MTTTINKNGYEVVKQFIDYSFANFLKNYFDVIVRKGICDMGDDQAPNSFCIYGDAAFDTLMVMCVPTVSYTHLTLPTSG